MGALTVLKLCNRALSEVGAKVINDLEDDSIEAEECGNFYASSVGSILSAHTWSFAGSVRRLSRKDETPETDWLYRYAAPEDFIKVRSLGVGSSSKGVDYGFEDGHFLTNVTEVVLAYTRRAKEGDMPDYFGNLVVEYLAAELVVPLGSGSISERAERRDHYEKISLPNAIFIDKSQQPIQKVRPRGRLISSRG